VVRMMKWTAEIERVYGEAWWRLENIYSKALFG
jgi:hypothetical protein